MVQQFEKIKDYLSSALQNRATRLLTVIIVIALWLRVWGIGYGLPYDLWMDGTHEILRALKLGAGEYSWTFGKGGLYYILFVEYGLMYVVWWLLGWVGSPREFAVLFIRDPSAFFLAGRLTVAFMGVLTCVVVFLLGRRIYDWRAGLAAAFIGATAYYHGAHSHMINVDIGMTLALWASILAYVKYEEQKDRRWLIGAGVLAGVAIAFKLPGAIVLLPLLLAIGSYPPGWRYPRRVLTHAGIVVLTMLVTLTVVAPEWTSRITSFHQSFSRILGKAAEATGPDMADFDGAVDSVTIFRGKERWGYFNILLKDYNVALTLTALLGICVGLLRRNRWDMIWTVLIITFLGIMSAADRTQAERYLLPIAPALWLLSSRAIVAISGNRAWLLATGLACVVAIPVVALARHNYELTRPDTRLIAKEWIEANIPSDAKILMDGMRYRFVMSPPLTPNQTALEHQVAEAAQSERQLSRGVSQRTLALYAEAMKQIKGPAYELHSTVWGLAVEDPSYYLEHCFDYIITSSHITGKYASETSRDRFPKSAQFYEQLNTDARFQKVYSLGPLPLERTGPTITVYKVLSACHVS